jgi:hypothetical protein
MSETVVHETPEQELLRLRAENAALKVVKARTGLKVSEKGAVSFYGLGRWPVTLYESQWRRVIAEAGVIAAFLDANVEKLAKREE